MMKERIDLIEDGCFKWTFDAKKVKRFVEIFSHGDVLNLFAGKNRLNIPETRVDISNEFKPDFNQDAESFLKEAIQKNWNYDTIIYDPPWNERKSKELYKGRYVGKFTKLKDDIVRLLADNGLVISIGYTITNFGGKRGMELIKLAVVNPKGEIRPYFISLEMKYITLQQFLN